jgi:membrane fusion protein
LAWCVCSLFVLGAIALLFVEYSEKVTVYGATEPELAPVTVFSPRWGVVKQVPVMDGDWVHAGEVLVSIDLSLRHGDGHLLLATTASGLRERLATLASEDAEVVALAALDAAQLWERQQSLKREVDLVSRRTEISRRQHGVAQEYRASVTRLFESKNVSRIEVGRANANELQALDAMVTHQQMRQQLDRESADLEHQRHVHERKVRLQRLRLERERGALQSELNSLLESEEIAIVAPISGRVTNLFAKVGLHTTPQLPLATLVAQAQASADVDDRDLQRDVLLALPSGSAGRVETGMDLQLRFAGFPVQQYGLVRGSVVAVGEVAVGGAAVANATEPYFRVRARLVDPPSFIDKVPHGMQVEADVHVARKPLWRWLIAPVHSALGRL